MAGTAPGVGPAKNRNSRAAIGVLVAVGTVGVIPVSIGTAFLGIFIACYGDYDGSFCSSDASSIGVLAAIGVPILIALVGGIIGIVRRSWWFAVLSLILSGVAVFALFVGAIAFADSRG